MKYEREIREIISKTIEATEPVGEISIDFNLQGIGMTSITFVRLIVEVEDFFNIEFPDDKMLLSESGTIKGLCDILNSILINNQKNCI